MATATGARVIPGAVSITEWYSRINSSKSETCGQASVAMALHLVKGTPATTAFVTQLSQETVDNHQVTDYPHASTGPSHLQWLFRRHGVTATIHRGDWETAVRAFVGVKPIVLGLGHARALGGHDSTVDGHYICIFGVTGDGRLVVGDPNTPESTSGALVTYSLPLVRAAAPFAALVPAENPIAGLPVVGSTLDAVFSPANAAIHHVNGFSDLVVAIAADERPSAPNLGTMLDLPGWIFSNMTAWLIRGVVIGTGLLLILAVLIQAIKQGDPDFWQSLSPAGAGPAMANASGTADLASAAGGIPLEAVAL